MPIASSVIADTSVQRDGRKWVTEVHTDHVGVKYSRMYLAAGADDMQAALTTYAGQLVTSLRDAELAQNVEAMRANGRNAVVMVVHSTAAENHIAARNAYLSATRMDAVMLGDYLASLTDTQLRAAFNMTAAQVTTLRTSKLTPAATTATTLRAVTGA